MKDPEYISMRFTLDELKAIHYGLFNMPWNGETFYVPRKEVIRKLDRFFGPNHAHLKLTTR